MRTTKDYELEKSELGTMIRRGVMIFAAMFLLITAWSAYYTVDEGERGVYLHWGAFAGISEPGLSFKMPFVTSIHKVSMRPFLLTFNSGGGLSSYSKDQQTAVIRVSVNARVIDARRLYIYYQDLDNATSRIITPRVYEQVKNVFGQFTAAESIQNRTKLNTDVSSAIIAAVNSVKDTPLVVEAVQIENIDFSDEYEKAVEDQMQATVMQKKAEVEKLKRIINADAAAYEVKAQADAQAHRIAVQGEAEAKAIRARGDALRENPALPSLVTAEKWDGKLPTSMPPGGAVPFITVK